MGNNITFYIWTSTTIITLLTFLFVCGSLTKSRFTTKNTTIIIFSGTILSVILNTAVFLHSHDMTSTLAMISLTAYLPAIIILHILSDSEFCRTVPIWCMGLFAVYAESLLIKVILHILPVTGLVWYSYYAIQLLITLTIAFLICIVTIKYIRKPFNQYIRCSEINWSIPLALIVLMIAIFSYFYNSPYDSIVSFLLFLTAMMSFFIIIKLFRAEYSRQQLKKEQDEYEIRFKIQQKEFLKISHKHELLSNYRHDMRHHLLALSNILHDSDNTYAEKYIGSLIERLENTENITYCKNKMINAILSCYIDKAKKIGCALDLHISIPEKLNIKDIDLCIVLSNALENAIDACEKEDESLRYIKIKMDFHNSLCISIKNTCNQKICFDQNGLPVIELQQEGHGIGLKSIANTVKKYDGIFRCECSNNEFKLNIIMFDIAKEEPAHKTMNTKKTFSAIFFSIICICIFLNLSPIAANALTDIPVVGPVVRVITAKQHRFGWGQNKFEVAEPEILIDLPDILEQKPFLENMKIISVCPASVLSNTISAETDVMETATFSTESSAGETFIPSIDTAAAQKTTNSDTPAASVTTPSQVTDSFNTQETATTTEPETSTPDILETVVTTQEPETSSPNIPETSAATQECTNSDTTTPEKISSLEEGVEEMNKELDEYIEMLRQKYIWYVTHKYMGYVSLKTSYTILLNNDDILSIRFDSTLNAGGSAEFSRCFSLDKHTGNLIELADLFLDEADYITPVSSYILEQMTIQVKNGEASYFIPGGIWHDEECFKSISEKQNFYINDQSKLVIVFDEYEVAPGSMGCVEFVIPTAVIDTILSKNSFIQ